MQRDMGSNIAYAAALAAAAFQSAVPSQPVPLEPSGPWTVEYADSMCIVGRKFGTGQQEMTLGFRPGPMSEYMRVALWLSDDSQKYKLGAAILTIDGAPPVPALYKRGPIPIKGMHLVQIDTTKPEIGNLEAAKTLHVRADNLNLSFRLGNISGAMKALQKCERDLLISWGMDPAALDSIETPAFHRNIVSLFSTNDYPSSAIYKGEQGTAGVHFRIGIDGKVSDCRVVETSGSSALDAQTCKIIVKRARYEPAKTKTGEPVASIGFQRIRWEM
jgi:TonB family protein